MTTNSCHLSLSTVTTRKGTFWMRWLGDSNGYYGEEPAITILGGSDD